MATTDVAVLIGSLRRESLTRKIAHNLIARAPETLKMEIVEIGDLPLYNQDLEAAAPPAWDAFRAHMRAMQAVLFVTPEYNRLVPAALKNAIDVGSRPHGDSVWRGKPCAIVSASPGARGGFGANHDLRHSLVFLDMPVMMQPEAYIGGADKLVDADGKITNAATAEFLASFMNKFAVWIQHQTRI